MKIGYMLTTFPCRSETFAAREIESLRKLGFDITVFAATANRYLHRFSEDVKVLYRPCFFSFDTISSIKYMVLNYPLGLFKLLYLIVKLFGLCPREAVLLISNLHAVSFFARQVDLDNVSHIHAYFLSRPACIGLALAKITGRTFSIAAHARDIFVERGAIKLKVSNAGFVVACTRQGLEHLKTNLPSEYHKKLYLNYHGVNTNSENPAFYDGDDCELKSNSTVIAAGRLVQKKGFAKLLEAFALVRREIPSSILMIVGQGPEQKKLNELIEELSLEDCVHLAGWQDHDVTLRLIRQATVLAAPSIIADDGDRDGIPNVILEAFAAGTAVIASNLEGISEVVNDEQTGLLVEPGDIEKLGCVLKRLLTDSGLRGYLSENARKVITDKFDSAKNIEILADLFKNSLDAK